MEPIIFKMRGTEYPLIFKLTTYPEGNLAVKLYQEDYGQLIYWDALTVNLSGLRAKNCGFINTKTTGKRFYAWIKRNGLGVPTGQVRQENEVQYLEYLFNAKKMMKLDPEGYTYYLRHLNEEVGMRYKRLYLALHRISKYVPQFRYTDYSGWRCLNTSTRILPLWIEAEDPAHNRRFKFEHYGIMLRTTITDLTTGATREQSYRRKEDMAAELISMFQSDLPAFSPWSEERHRKSELRHEFTHTDPKKESYKDRAGKK